MGFMCPDNYVDYLSLIHRNIYKTHFNASHFRIIRHYLRLIEDELNRLEAPRDESL